MRFLLRAGLLLTLLASLGLNGYFLYHSRQAAIPAKILDGDTFQLADGDRVRLLGANAPEGGRCGSAEAANEKLLSAGWARPDYTQNSHHLPSRRHYDKIVLDLDLGEQFFCTEAEAQAAGFILAPDCLR